MGTSVTILQAGAAAPAAGEYRVVNRHGHYLGSKVECGQGNKLPPTEGHYEDGWVFHTQEAVNAG